MPKRALILTIVSTIILIIIAIFYFAWSNKKSFTYKNEQYGFTLTFPASWSEKKIYVHPEGRSFGPGLDCASLQIMLPTSNEAWQTMFEDSDVLVLWINVFKPDVWRKTYDQVIKDWHQRVRKNDDRPYGEFVVFARNKNYIFVREHMLPFHPGHDREIIKEKFPFPYLPPDLLPRHKEIKQILASFKPK